VRKATIKNAAEVKSKGFGEAAGVLCMFYNQRVAERGGVYAVRK
jgi:hypothetical protein